MRAKLAFVAACFLSATAANAATVTTTVFKSTSSVAEARGFGSDYVDLNPVLAGTGFEAPIVAAPGSTTGNLISTAAGAFSGLGGTGSGGSAIAPFNEIKVRSGQLFGRQNITEGGANWLDTNDTLGISWVIDATTLNLANGFRSLSFFLTDAVDQGSTVTISAGDSAQNLSPVQTILRKAQPNAAINFIALAFDEAVKFARVEIRNSGLNDGFGIDDARVHAAPVPVPAAFGLLAAAFAGLGVIARRRKAALA